jgi:hypothetical protein
MVSFDSFPQKHATTSAAVCTPADDAGKKFTRQSLLL